MRSKSSKRTTAVYSKRGKRTKEKRVREPAGTVWYHIPYPASAYTFPKDSRIRAARFDDEYLHIELTDRRILSIPLTWIPSLHYAAPEERQKYELGPERTMLIWDPDKCAINDEIRIADYMMPCRDATQISEQPNAKLRVKQTIRHPSKKRAKANA